MSAKHATRGVIFIHSVSPAVRPHVEWAVSSVLGYDVRFLWTAQPALPSMSRAEVSWVGDVGTGAMLASALGGWEHLRFEVTEDGTAVSEGGRWSATPGLGIFYAQTDLMGNVVVPENRIRAAIDQAGDASFAQSGPRAGLGRRARAFPLRRCGRAGSVAPPSRVRPGPRRLR